MHFLQFQLLFLSLSLSLIKYVYPASRMYTTGTKYENSVYLDLFKVPNNYISSLVSPGSYQNTLKNAFDGNLNTHWLSPEEGTKVKDPTTGVIYNSLKINITISFTKKVFIKSMIYQAWSKGSSLGIGYPEELNVYYSLQNGNNAKFTLADYTKSTATDKKVVFTFPKIIECNQINLEWKKIHATTSYKNKASVNDIIFLYPETNYINSTLINAFDKTDYRQLTINQNYKNFNKYKTYIDKDLSLYGYNDDIKIYINRINDILNGFLRYDSKREFSTVFKSANGMIAQRGDIEQYAKNILKMKWVGTNRQSTGIYGRSNQKITIYVKAEKSTDPLPSIQFTQYIGESANWLGSINKLKIGKQVLYVDNFKLKDDLKIPTFPGGPLYLINPYNSSQQSQVSVYIEGGATFPTFTFGNNITEYKKELLQCINQNKMKNTTYFDITELFGLKEIITVRASDAYKIYSNENNINPSKNLLLWDDYLERLYKFDGVQFINAQPYYNKLNNYINIHYRYAQPYGLAYASSTRHVGIFYNDWIELILNFNMKQVGWGYAHETGHMMDISERELTENTNNMLSKYYDAFLCGNNTWGINDHQKNKIKYLTKDNIEQKLRGCELVKDNNCMGFLKNNIFNYLVFWDLESINHGYWGKLDNMYRYNNTLPSGITREEKFVFFSSIIFKMDLGYYFTRWGLSFSNSNNIFNEKNTTTLFRSLMNSATSKGLIDAKAPKKKFWYLDNEQYKLNSKVKGCYSNQTKYNIQIVKVIKQGTKYRITLPQTTCTDHLGFEIYETNTLIGFTYENTYIDETTYKTGYTPKYKIIAYDRQLYYSKASTYKSYTNNVALKIMNFNHILNE